MELEFGDDCCFQHRRADAVIIQPPSYCIVIVDDFFRGAGHNFYLNCISMYIIITF